ncbi:hypothetical protein DPMN_052825 [Dreissena polymorpha]|uniref:Uncharacterized protein n=1 Tax=Dreissena polymorpha TaxID=45954 RepID=A0A9D4CLK4_DREPO|nr:hypothetical protein DPMN_052825 [Dreissena polymorpha]
MQWLTSVHQHCRGGANREYNDLPAYTSIAEVVQIAVNTLTHQRTPALPKSCKSQ